MFYTVCVVSLIYYAVPFFERHAEQDRCEFGTGSTALYERMRREASSFLAANGRVRLSGYSLEAASEFRRLVWDQLRQFALSRDSAVERTAAMHALLRSYGMKIDSSSPRDPKKRKSNQIVLGYNYLVLLPKLNWFCPLCYVFRTARFSVSIDNKITGQYANIQGGGLFITWFKRAPVFYLFFGDICPEIMDNV